MRWSAILLQWGHDFRPAYLALASLRSDFADVPILALTVSHAITALCSTAGPSKSNDTVSAPNFSHAMPHRRPARPQCGAQSWTSWACGPRRSCCRPPSTGTCSQLPCTRLAHRLSRFAERAASCRPNIAYEVRFKDLLQDEHDALQALASLQPAVLSCLPLRGLHKECACVRLRHGRGSRMSCLPAACMRGRRHSSTAPLHMTGLESVDNRTWSSNQVMWDRCSAGPAALRPGGARRVRDRVCAPAQDVRVAGARALRRRGRRGGLPCRAGRRAAPAHAARLVAGRHQRRGAPWLASAACLRSLPRRAEAGSGGSEATVCDQHVVA